MNFLIFIMVALILCKLFEKVWMHLIYYVLWKKENKRRKKLEQEEMEYGLPIEEENED